MKMDRKFYLGRIFDHHQAVTTPQPLYYDPRDLTTHAVVVGMTGSGKTGLCIDLLEEAALNNIPALMIDPKGDITNTLLHFPDLLPDDFMPWVNPDEARRSGKSVEQAAQEAATTWQQGLREWDIEPERLRALKNAAHFAVYTPGSTAGISVSIMDSLKAPSIAWDDNRELLREKISGTVTALLGLVGLAYIDPVRSREHILLANIFEHAWSQRTDLDLGELILQTQSPPFEKLGVFAVDTFFPEKDRFALAMSLNNILAAPSFQSWIEGQPLDIPSLLYGPDGRPRHSVFYIAHLPDSERMFFVTLLFSALEAWMRSQSGRPSLKALVYFDEIFGYLPPISNPPSKQPMLRLLKQARAFGVGLVLVTQNPVDVDYKALSNAGTWFIGKLQTEKDKERLLDGLQGAMPGSLDRSTFDRLISGLGKRVFLLHNIHDTGGKRPNSFHTRWAMNYLAGPLTRAQIPALNQLAGASLAGAVSETLNETSRHDADRKIAPETGVQQGASPGQPTSLEAEDLLPGVVTQPRVPAGIGEYFLPHDLTLTQAFKVSGRTMPRDAQGIGLIYRPALLGQAHIRFLNRKYSLDHETVRTVLVEEPNPRGVVHWQNETSLEPLEPERFDSQPDARGRFGALESPLSDARMIRSLKADFQDWVYREVEVVVRANEELDIYAGPDLSAADFRKMCADAAREKRDAAMDKVSDSYQRKLDRLEERLHREERELEEDRTELSQRKMEEMGTHAEVVLSLFSKRRRSLSSSLSKRRMTERAKADVEESIAAIDDLEADIREMEAELAEKLEALNDQWGQIANQVDEIRVRPYKKDVLLDLFGVAWIPYHIVQLGKAIVELPGFHIK